MTQPSHRPPRQIFVVHAGAVAEQALLPEWWGALGSEVESRSLRFPRDGSTWLDEGELPASLTAAGCRLSEVAEVDDHPGLADPSLSVGQPVRLRPEPNHSGDRDAIAVWTEDSSQRIGYLLGEIAAETMRESHRRRSAYRAFVAGEQRDATTRERRALAILLGPGVVWAEEAT